jgi:hypothetical protein
MRKVGQKFVGNAADTATKAAERTRFGLMTKSLSSPRLHTGPFAAASMTDSPGMPHRQYSSPPMSQSDRRPSLKDPAPLNRAFSAGELSLLTPGRRPSIPHTTLQPHDPLSGTQQTRTYFKMRETPKGPASLEEYYKNFPDIIEAEYPDLKFTGFVRGGIFQAFHGTTEEAVRKIMEEGVDTSHTGKNWDGYSQEGSGFYLFLTPGPAVTYAGKAVQKSQNPKDTLCQVIVAYKKPADPGSPSVVTKPDRNQEPEEDWHYTEGHGDDGVAVKITKTGLENSTPYIGVALPAFLRKQISDVQDWLSHAVDNAREKQGKLPQS